MGCVTQLRWKRAKFDHTWVRLKTEAELACACQRVRPISPTRSKLNLLTTECDGGYEHWQQKNTVVVCGDLHALGAKVQSPPTQ
jgi:hypothetical protein